jgi:hypothetical protein
LAWLFLYGKDRERTKNEDKSPQKITEDFVNKNGKN